MDGKGESTAAIEKASPWQVYGPGGGGEWRVVDDSGHTVAILGCRKLAEAVAHLPEIAGALRLGQRGLVLVAAVAPEARLIADVLGECAATCRRAGL